LIGWKQHFECDVLAQDLKKRFLTEKIKPVMLVLPSHAGNRKKTPDYYLLS